MKKKNCTIFCCLFSVLLFFMLMTRQFVRVTIIMMMANTKKTGVLYFLYIKPNLLNLIIMHNRTYHSYVYI